MMAEQVRSIRGIGEKTEKQLKRLKIETTDDLIRHYPRCYLTYGDPLPLAEIRTGVRCSVCGELTSPVHMKAFGKRKLCTCLVTDQTGHLFLRWFNMPWLRSSLTGGERYIFVGTPVYKDGRIMMEQPEIIPLSRYGEYTRTFQPVYALTAGLSNKTLQKAIKTVFDDHPVPDYLPDNMRLYYDLEEEGRALHEIHFPSSRDHLDAARKRIIFDEFFRFFAGLEMVRERSDHALNRHVILWNDKVKAFLEQLPYRLTEGQKQALADIRSDLGGTMTMNRLIQGDVGSGKTLVAMTAMYAAVTNGYQGVFMAPTEILAQQHYEKFRNTFEPLGVKVGLLTGSMNAAARREARDKCASGEYRMIIGTHALIQEGVSFPDLALAVTDEQHRFGVKQRDALMQKGNDPHVLVMSATPIPRTLAIILYRDLDVSLMRDMPADRLPIKNAVIGEKSRQTAWTFIQKEISRGHQAYIICPLIEESEGLDAENVLEYTTRISQAFPPSVRIRALHGRMSADEKTEIMEEFARGEIDLLVSTTVIEVGIDVPGATVILIEDAQRFGLAQLHQLRGRVGRGNDQSYCIFLSGTDQKDAMERLSVIGRSNDGFAIADEDLKLRGPGDFFGTRQSGTMRFALGDIYENSDIMKMASEAVSQFRSEGCDFGKLLPEMLENDLNYARNI